MAMIEIKRNQKNAGTTQTVNVYSVMIVIKFTKILALNLKKQEYVKKKIVIQDILIYATGYKEIAAVNYVVATTYIQK